MTVLVTSAITWSERRKRTRKARNKVIKKLSDLVRIRDEQYRLRKGAAAVKERRMTYVSTEHFQ